jgi:hypothetical protein
LNNTECYLIPIQNSHLLDPNCGTHCLYPSHIASLRSHKLNQISSQCAYSVLENVPAAVAELRDLGASKIQQLVYFSGGLFSWRLSTLCVGGFSGSGRAFKGFLQSILTCFDCEILVFNRTFVSSVSASKYQRPHSTSQFSIRDSGLTNNFFLQDANPSLGSPYLW